MPEYEGFVSIEMWQLLFTLINTFILYLIVKKLLFKPVQNMIASRKDAIEGTYRAADEANAQAEKMRQEYVEHLNHAKQEANQIVADASKRAQWRSEEIIGEAALKAANMVQRAEEQISLEKRKAVDAVKNEISEIVVLAASKVVKKDLSPQDHEELIDSFIDQVGEDKKWKS